MRTSSGSSPLIPLSNTQNACPLQSTCSILGLLGPFQVPFLGVVPRTGQSSPVARRTPMRKTTHPYPPPDFPPHKSRPSERSLQLPYPLPLPPSPTASLLRAIRYTCTTPQQPIERGRERERSSERASAPLRLSSSSSVAFLTRHLSLALDDADPHAARYVVVVASAHTALLLRLRYAWSSHCIPSIAIVRSLAIVRSISIYFCLDRYLFWSRLLSILVSIAIYFCLDRYLFLSRSLSIFVSIAICFCRWCWM